MGATPGTGYASGAYATAVAGDGTVVPLPRAGSNLIRRPIPGSGSFDAAAPAPMLQSADWSGLAADLAVLADVVAVVAVPDPLRADPVAVAEAFPDHDRPLKTHHLVRFAGDWRAAIHKQHRYYARRALRSVDVRLVDADAFVVAWRELHPTLARRHGIDRDEDLGSSLRQFEVPDLVRFVAFEADVAVAAHCWMVTGSTANSHLAASSDRGYELSASYALYAAALAHLAEVVDVCNLGGNAGAENPEDGLSRFKRRWANDQVTARIVGRVCDADQYRELMAGRGGGWFPAYRSP